MNESLRELVADYCEALKSVGELKAKARKRQAAGKADMVVLSSMENDLKWAIEYMKTGHMPAYGGRNRKKTLPANPQRILHSCGKAAGRERMAQREDLLLDRLRSALGRLSPEERKALLLVKGQGIPYYRAAEYMHVGKPTVHAWVERALKKVSDAVQ